VGGGSPAQLIGRDQDLEFLCSFVDQAAVQGGALLLSGDAGVGKTVLLEVMAAHAASAGTFVLREAWRSSARPRC
jgi:predicted ATP-dependent serine protease